MAGQGHLEVRWVESEGDIPAQVWDACFGPPHEGRWWYRAMERGGLGDQFSFAYGMIERHEGGQVTPVGIAPTFVMALPLEIVAPPVLQRVLRVLERFTTRLTRVRTLFVGSPCADEGRLGLLSGVDAREAVRVTQVALVARAKTLGVRLIVWKDMDEGLSRVLRDEAPSHALVEVVSFPGTRTAVPPGGITGYMKSLKGSNRSNIKRKLKRSDEMGPLDVAVVQHPDSAEQREIFDLFWQTYTRATTKFERLTPEFFALLAAAEQSWFVTLRHPQDGKLAAFMLCFRLGDRVINKFVGFDYSMDPDWFLYFRLFAAAMDWASSIGASEMQSGQTGYSAKLTLGHSLVPLTNFAVHRWGVVNAILRKVAKGIDWDSLDHDLAERAKGESGKSPSTGA
ncbi:MAG: GNAT family N-acetyltransferase [Planctomycetota bacterium]